MSQPLRLLIVEDSPVDAEIMLRELSRGGFAPTSQRVETEDEMRTALGQPWNIILADYTLPGLSGRKALDILKESGREIPFILVSGTIQEDFAADVMRAGAKDYICKDSLVRLAAVVERELREAQARREALHQERELLRAVLETIAEGVVTCDLHDTITYANRAAQELLRRLGMAGPLGRWEDHIQVFRADGKTQLDRQQWPWTCAVGGTRALAQDVVVRSQTGLSRRLLVGGQCLHNSAGQRIGAVVAFLDVSDQRLLEDQLRQAQKMEAIGHLASGVAHDFNNLLTAINGCSELLLMDLEPGASQRGLLEEIKKAGERAALLTRQLLTFARRQPVAPQAINLNQVIAETVTMLRRVIGKEIEMHTTLQPDLGSIHADPGQMSQVLLNLTVNARDAMPRGGSLGITTANVVLDAMYARAHPHLKPGTYVLLVVSDTGHGMSPDVRARIFEPFFTTKSPEQGTGLGLSTVFRIVRQCHGHIEVESHPGLGTAFRIYLPCTEPDG
jgi:signal transduction histidine kinase